METLAMKEVLEKGRGFFEVNEERKQFRSSVFLKYETRLCKFDKILTNDEIKKYDTTINKIMNFFFEEEKEIYKNLKQDNQDNKYRMAYKINSFLGVYVLNFMKVFNYENGTFKVSFTEYLPYREREDGLHNAYGYKDELEKKYPKFTFKIDSNYDVNGTYKNKNNERLCEIILTVIGEYEDIKEVIAKSGYKKLVLDNFNETLCEYMELVQKETKFENYKIIPTNFKNIDDLF